MLISVPRPMESQIKALPVLFAETPCNDADNPSIHVQEGTAAAAM